MSTSKRTGKPKITSSQNGDGSVRIRHREYLFDLTGANLWTVQSIQINPGLQLFTWLSQLASLYESYVFNSLSFDFESTSPTTQAGTVMLGIDFDAADNLPVSKQEFMSMQGAVRTAPWQRVAYNATAQNLKKFGIQRYVRSGALAPSLDVKTYDVGQFLIAVQSTAVVNLGEIYVTYDITLHTPQGGPLVSEYNSANIFFNSTVSAAQPFGLSAQIKGGLPCAYRDGNTFKITKPGQYLVNFRVDGTNIDDNETITLNVPLGNAYGEISLIQQLFSNAALTQGAFAYRMNVKSPDFYFLFTVSSATVTSTVLRISAYQYSLD